jgi:hypothetical protein
MRDLAGRFVRLRIVTMAGVDLSLFQFDPFLSWSVLFLNGDRTIYGRYGCADPATKRSVAGSNPNHTVAGLEAAMRRALEVHAGYAKDPEAWAPRLAGKRGPGPPWRYAERTPAAVRHGRGKVAVGDGEKGCFHCHEVHRAVVDSMFMEKRPIPDSMLWVHPRPSVLGLEFDRERCARVTAVEPGSLAARAGLEPGDDLEAMAGQPLLSPADVRWVLHNFPDGGGDLPVEVLRGGKASTRVLSLPAGWRRKEDFVWRYRLAGYASWLWAGVGFRDDPGGVLVDRRSPDWFKKPNRDGRSALRPGDLVVEVDGRKGMDRSALLAYLMREKALGSTVTMVVVRGGKRETVKFRIPEEQPEVWGG